MAFLALGAPAELEREERVVAQRRDVVARPHAEARRHVVLGVHVVAGVGIPRRFEAHAQRERGTGIAVTRGLFGLALLGGPGIRARSRAGEHLLHLEALLSDARPLLLACLLV